MGKDDLFKQAGEVMLEQQRLEAKAEREKLRELAMIWLCRIGLLVFVCSLPWGLSGCATVPEEEIVAQVCYMRYMGKSEEGYAVVMTVCQSPESFAASQK